MTTYIPLYAAAVQDAASRNDLNKMRQLRAAAGSQLAELRGHIAHLDELLQQHGATAASIPPYGVPPQDPPEPREPEPRDPKPREPDPANRAGVMPLYGVPDQLGSAVPLYGVAPNPMPLYGVVIQDAVASGDIRRMKAVASSVRAVLTELDAARALLEDKGTPTKKA